MARETYSFGSAGGELEVTFGSARVLLICGVDEDGTTYICATTPEGQRHIDNKHRSVRYYERARQPRN